MLMVMVCRYSSVYQSIKYFDSQSISLEINMYFDSQSVLSVQEGMSKKICARRQLKILPDTGPPVGVGLNLTWFHLNENLFI